MAVLISNLLISTGVSDKRVTSTCSLSMIKCPAYVPTYVVKNGKLRYQEDVYYYVKTLG
jgi:hypothetical protein